MKLGEFAEFDSVGKRDAFHVSAVIAVATKEDLSPGESVRFLDTSLKEVEPCIPSARHGIVDPFLKNRVIPGSAVQILLRPDGVTNLSHHFDVNFLVFQSLLPRRSLRTTKNTTSVKTVTKLVFPPPDVN